MQLSGLALLTNSMYLKVQEHGHLDGVTYFILYQAGNTLHLERVHMLFREMGVQNEVRLV